MEPKKRSSNQLSQYMPKIRRYAPVIIISIFLIVTFVTCGRNETQNSKEQDPVISEEPSPDVPVIVQEPEDEEEPVEIETEPEDTGPFNPLTGLPLETDISQQRPLAIMINNNSAAMPQLGVSKADIIYETLAEGDITRMLAIYQDVSGVGVIGSIRSARHYFVDLVQSYDAIFIFAGGSPQAYTALSDRKITRLDGVNGSLQQIFYRDSYRMQNMSMEHTMVTSSGLIERWLPTYGFRLEHKEGFKSNLLFADDGTPDTDSQASKFTVKYDSSKSTAFSYDVDDKLYYIRQHGDYYIDGNDGKQLSFTNVLILKTDITLIPGDREGRRDVKTTGSGTGYFICGGKYIEIQWSRADNSSQFAYTLKDGSELLLGRGKTFICIAAKADEIKFE